MKELIHSIHELLKQGEDLVLATIVKDHGSTPRATGAKMIIRKDGRITGTIGGGLLEATAIQAAPDIFQSKGFAILKMDMTQDKLNEIGMICGGKVEFLLEHVPADIQTTALFDKANNSIKNRCKSFFITGLEDSGSIQRFLITAGANIPDSLPQGETIENITESTMLYASGKYFWTEPLFSPDTMLIFGAGHVAKEVAELGIRVGFRTIVFDDRNEFANKERFPKPIEPVVLDKFANCFSDLTINKGSYVIIVTRGHMHDKTVLSQALKTDAGYIGMIGSSRKREATYRELMDEGFIQEDLDRVYSPIGMSIGAETPEEIAVSILAELIRIRSEKRE